MTNGIFILDNYETIHQYKKRYVETGLTTTSNHGRGQRMSKRNERFHDSKEDAEQEESTVAHNGNTIVFLK